MSLDEVRPPPLRVSPAGSRQAQPDRKTGLGGFGSGGSALAPWGGREKLLSASRPLRPAARVDSPPVESPDARARPSRSTGSPRPGPRPDL